MKVLLDENMPSKLRNCLAHHESITVGLMGWNGLKNGALLTIAEDQSFEILVTGDQSLTYPQNLADRRIAVMTLSANNWPLVENHLAQIVEAVDSALPGSSIPVDLGDPPESFLRPQIVARSFKLR